MGVCWRAALTCACLALVAVVPAEAARQRTTAAKRRSGTESRALLDRGRSSDAPIPRTAKRVAAKAPKAHKAAGRTRATADDDAERGSRGRAEEHLHLKKGDTLESVLAARGVEAAEVRPWIAAANIVYDLRRVQPRRGLTLRFDRATHALEAVRYEIDDRTLLVLDRSASGGIVARKAALPYFTELRGTAGRIERGLREDAIEAGVPEHVVSEVADIFGWEVDVASDLRVGDEFRIIYENLWQTGEASGEAGKVLGAEIVAKGKKLTAVYFEDEDGRGGYYRPSGEAVSRSLLRYPLEFTEISSEFSLLRAHPILRRNRPHLGVDFAAPRGTPVRAVAQGTVEFSGWANQLGHSVQIAHAGALASTYGHLARIAAGVKEGASVERGQVIGYVGATGLATGPHLHFALHKDDEYLDPLKVVAEREASIPETARKKFDRLAQVVRTRLAALPASIAPRTVSLSTSDFRLE
jgi:murein DD-endopeptidase MepM/ murein hydrolase activator NlpD